MSKRILVVSWFFPPVNSSEGLVTYKILNNSKLEYDVITQNVNDSWSYGKNDELKLGNNINCIRFSTETMDEFEKEAIDYFEKNKNKYDIVMTRSMSEISHIIGLKMKEIKKEIIWIASFGDPIANNPFTLQMLNNENPYSLQQRYNRKMGIKEMISPKRMIKSELFKYRKKKDYNRYIKENNILQQRVLNNCDYVIYNNKYQKEYMLKDYNNKEELEKKTIILPHTYDEKLYPNKEVKNNKIIFSFVGHLDDIRTPHSLFEAIKRLSEFDNSIDKKVEFNFYGNLSDKEKLYLLNNDLLNLVKIKKSIGYLKSLEIMQESDWLINIDANINNIVDDNIFFAAKIADYIGAKRKILGITMINGSSADIFREYNALCIENCVDEIYNYLYLIIYQDYNINLNLDYREKYNAKKVANDFDKYIEKMK